MLLQFSVSLLFDNEQLFIQVCIGGMLVQPFHRIFNALCTRSFWKLHKQCFFRCMLSKSHINQLLYNVLLHIRCNRLPLVLRILCCFQLGFVLFVLFLLKLFSKSHWFIKCFLLFYKYQIMLIKILCYLEKMHLP